MRVHVDGEGGPSSGRRSRQRLVQTAVALGAAGVAFVGGAGVAGAATPGPLPQAGAPGLPNGRGLELVSPAEKNGVDVAGPVLNPTTGGSKDGNPAFQISADDSSVMFAAAGGFAGAQSIGSYGFSSYKAVRTASGWQTIPATPPALASPAGGLGTGEVTAASPDLSDVTLTTNQPLAAGTPTGQANVFVRRGGVHTLLTPTLGVMAEMYGPIFAPQALMPVLRGTSNDLSQGVFYSPDALLPGDAPSNSNLYAWKDGVLRLVAADADAGLAVGSESEWALVGGTSARAISADGRRLAYSSPLSNIAQVYVTVDGGTPVQASASQGGSSGSNDRIAAYQGMSADGKKVFFTSAASLTPDAHTYTPTEYAAMRSRGDLYVFDVTTGVLKNLTPASMAGPNGAAVNKVVGISDDGDSVYVTAQQQLDGTGEANRANIYLLRDGQPRYIGRYEGLQATQTSLDNFQRTPDGQHLVFLSKSRVLADYDNAGQFEVYSYSAADDEVTCVSCRPDGSKPTRSASIAWPAQSGVRLGAIAPNRPRTMSDDGKRIFFSTADALLPEASNGQNNVYMYEDGKLSMISSGRDPRDTFLFGTTPSGNDVFFSSRARLVSADVDGSIDLYTARVGGGFPEPDPGPPPCEGDACQGPQTGPPSLLGAGSVAEAGGNLVPEKEPAAGPAASLKIRALSSSARKQLASGRRVQLPVVLVGGGKVSVRATASVGGHQRTVATATRTIRQTRSVTVNVGVRLSSAARKQLAKGKRLRVKFRVTSSQVKQPRTRTETIVRSAARNGRGA